MKINEKEVLADGSDYKLSISKLTGKKIIDAIGYISCEFDFPVFKITSLVFDDKSEIRLQGEHDIAFIPQDRDDRMPPNMDEETLQDLYDQSN